MTDTPATVGRLLGVTDDPAAVWKALETVVDPELGVGIVDLGLVYDVDVEDGLVNVTMTTTTPSCPIGDFLTDQIRWALLRLPGVLDVEVLVVHQPPWSPARMSETAKRQLGWLR